MTKKTRKNKQIGKVAWYTLTGFIVLLFMSNIFVRTDIWGVHTPELKVKEYSGNPLFDNFCDGGLLEEDVYFETSLSFGVPFRMLSSEHSTIDLSKECNSKLLVHPIGILLNVLLLVAIAGLVVDYENRKKMNV